jgi:predicted amidohydrolase YtcJ
VQPGDIPRFKQLWVPASVQLLWAFGDETTIDIVKPYIDPSIYKWQYPAKSMLDAGVLLCGASDWPVSSANPFQAISRAETRKGAKGVLDAAQRVSRKDMFNAYTANAAMLMGIQNLAGMLKPGMSADLIVVDRDVWTVEPESLWNTRVLYTIFEGKVTYKEKMD